MTTIGFIGLGNMGRPMAANLVKAGFKVSGYDVFARARDGAAADGVSIVGSVTDTADGADIVVTMLQSGRQVVEVFGALAKAVKPGTLLIDCSTVDVESARKAHGIAKEAGALSLDAPVSGGTGGAKAATLTFMAGGSAEAFERAEPVLSRMGKRLVHCGDAGAGQAAKICNNMILGISMIGVCEAFVLAEKLGLSHQALFDVGLDLVRPMLVDQHLLPGAGACAHLTRQQRLQTRFRRSPHAERPAALARGGPSRRRRHPARRRGDATLCAVRQTRPGRRRFLRHHPHVPGGQGKGITTTGHRAASVIRL